MPEKFGDYNVLYHFKFLTHEQKYTATPMDYQGSKSKVEARTAKETVGSEDTKTA